MEYPTMPKPLTYVENEDGTREATFERNELKSWVDGTVALSGVIQNNDGDVVGVARIRPLREMLSNYPPPA